MTPATRAEIGATIERIGSALTEGAITVAQALTEVRAADPTLTHHGALAQLRAWRTARTRYATPVDERPTQAPVDARELRRRTPIVFRVPAATGTER